MRVLDAKRLELSYKVAPGYYLYRERFKFSSPDAKLGEPQIPPGKKHYDTALEQNVETYHDGVVVIAARRCRLEQGVHAERHAPGLRRQGPVLPAAAAHRGRHAEGLRRRCRLRQDRGRTPTTPRRRASVAPVTAAGTRCGMSVASGALPDPLRSVKPIADRASGGAAGRSRLAARRRAVAAADRGGIDAASAAAPTSAWTTSRTAGASALQPAAGGHLVADHCRSVGLIGLLLAADALQPGRCCRSCRPSSSGRAKRSRADAAWAWPASIRWAWRWSTRRWGSRRVGLVGRGLAGDTAESVRAVDVRRAAA